MPIDIRGTCTLIQVFDMPTSLRFYRDVLGFEIIGRSSPGDDCNWAHLRFGDAELMLNTRYEADSRPPVPDAARVGAHDDTCLYFGSPDVDGAYEHLRAKGLDVKRPKVAPYGMKQLTLHDPDGFGVCFQWKA